MMITPPIFRFLRKIYLRSRTCKHCDLWDTRDCFWDGYGAPTPESRCDHIVIKNKTLKPSKNDAGAEIKPGQRWVTKEKSLVVVVVTEVITEVDGDHIECVIYPGYDLPFSDGRYHESSFLKMFTPQK